MNLFDSAASQLDIFATIMDYVGEAKPEQNDSDGESFRRLIERWDVNQRYDDGLVVGEIEKVSKNLNGKPSGIPNYMLRHKKYKMIIPKEANSDVTDM